MESEITKSVVVSGLIIPAATVINVGLGLLVVLICYFVLKAAYRRYTRRTEAIDVAKGELDLAKWHNAQVQKALNKDKKETK